MENHPIDQAADEYADEVFKEIEYDEYVSHYHIVNAFVAGYQAALKKTNMELESLKEKLGANWNE